ncbi:MAG: glycosyltransferase family 4 protein [Saprospiraceae bacterium]|nr:glycosyltransferase family 4 protein [Saprospiraceae bacterium]
MKGEEEQLLVFVLSRSGCLAYARYILAAMGSMRLKIIGSAYAVAPLPEGTLKVITYRNVFELILNSLWILPALLFYTLLLSFRGYRHVYFPVFHPWNLFLLMWCKLLGIKTFLTVHDGILHSGENHPLLQWWEKACIRTAGNLIFLSRFVADETSAKIGFSARHCVIPHGILPVGETPAPHRWRSRPRLLFLGRIARYKGVDALIEAVEGLPEDSYAQLTVAGMMVNEPARRGRPDKVHWRTGWLEEDEVNQLLREHDILILPYLEASQSGVLTLGIASAIPMVCTRVGGLPEQLGEEEAVWVEPPAAGIRAGIQILFNEPERYGQMVEALQERRKNSGWDVAAAQLRAFVLATSRELQKR